jgi:2-amino-4-hydroxy-6-hydroxymethyldihydropteridine diphosphokinase
MSTDAHAPPRSRRRVRAYLGLGANLGDPVATLTDAVGALDAESRLRVRGVSRLYATAPWGVTDQPAFRNAAVSIETALPPLELLAALKRLERAAGRGEGRRWGPRVLDLDLLLYGRHRIRVERPPAARSVDAETDPTKASRLLEVPHRDLGERLFVLAPLADLAPRLVPPGWHETIETRRRAVAATEPPDAVRVVGTWDAAAARWRRA